MQIALELILAIVQAWAPTATADIVAKIIKAIETLLPLIVAEYQALVPIVRNIIAALRGNGSVTSDQLDALDAMEAQIDAAFDQSDADAAAADDAAGQS